jgi:hypothetical protein
MDVHLTTPQATIFKDTTRFRVCVAGRRFGKSFLSGAELINAAIGVDKKTGKKKHKQTVVYIAPTFAMAKQIMWVWLKEFAPKSYIVKANESDLIMEFKNGSVIYLKSAENYDSLRGLSLSFVVMDEVADIKPDAWSLVVRPALSDQEGDALFIGTPKGTNHFYDWWLQGKDTRRKTWSSYNYTTIQGGNVSAAEIEEAKLDLSPRDFKQEYEASFEALSNRVVDMFDREANVNELVEDMGGELLVGMDFNVSPMSAVVGVRVGDELHIFDEFKQQNSNTRYMMETLVDKYPGREMTVFPDPSGRARKTSAIGGETDFTIIRSFGAHVIAPNKAPHVADSINALNTMMCNGAGHRRIQINPSCTALIKDLDTWLYEDDRGTGTFQSRPDKKSGSDHLPDALKYLVWSEFGMKGREARNIEVIGF